MINIDGKEANHAEEPKIITISFSKNLFFIEW